MVDFDDQGFTITPLAQGSKASPHTVSAHMLYENSDPFILFEPGGHLDVTEASYQPLDNTSVRVTGSRWVPSDTYTVKLEGARIAGYQSVTIVLLRDRRYVENAQAWADDITTKCRAKALERLNTDAFDIELRLIGASASFGELEHRDELPIEIGVMGIVTAQTEALTAEVAKMLDPYLLHHPLTSEEEQPTFAFPFSPAAMPRGAVYEFCLNHVLALKRPDGCVQT